MVGADTIVLFKKLLGRNMIVRGMKEYGSVAGRGDLFNLASCMARQLWAEGPVPVLYYSTEYRRKELQMLESCVGTKCWSNQ